MYPFKCARIARRAAARQFTKRPRTRLILRSLEDRIAPATSTLINGVLTIDFLAPMDRENVTVARSGTNIVLSGDVTGTSVYPNVSISQLVVRDSGGSSKQSITFSGPFGSNFQLSGGLDVSGVESVIVNASITVTGAGRISIVAPKTIQVGVGGSAQVTTVDGDIILKANHIGTPTKGTFHGIDVGGVINSKTGSIGLYGQSGDGPGCIGVWVRGNARVGGSTGGALLGTTGPVEIFGTSFGSGSNNRGVAVGGGAANAIVGSSGSDVTVVGEVGGAGPTSGNVGVFIISSGVGAGQNGAVTVHGTTGNSTGGGCFGVQVSNSPYGIGAGKSVTVTGVSGELANEAVELDNGGGIVADLGANLTIFADSLKIADALSSLKAGLGLQKTRVTIAPRTPGTKINLGGQDVLSGSGVALGLTTSELSRIFSGVTQVGDTNSGPITVVGGVYLPTNAPPLQLITGSTVTGTVAGLTVNNLSVQAKGSININHLDTDVGTVSLVSELGDITFGDDGSGYTVGTVNGQVGIQTPGNINLKTDAGLVITSNVSAGGTGAITISGNQLIGCRDITVKAGVVVSTFAGPVMLIANGIDVNNATVKSTSGAVTLQSLGGGSTVYFNDGVYIHAGGVVGGGTTGPVHIVGKAGPTSAAYGIEIDSGSIVTSGGNISITGFGGTLGRSEYGVWIGGTDSKLISNGGAVSITGYGGGDTASSGGNYGIIFDGQISAGTGDIIIHGIGGVGTGSGNSGVYFKSSMVTGDDLLIIGSGSGGGVGIRDVTAGISGTMTVQGDGSSLGTSGGSGVNFDGKTVLTKPGASLSVVGQAATYATIGVSLQYTTISTANGSISIIGHGGNGKNSYGYGVYLFGNVSSGPEASITAGGTGSITIHGTGGSGGVYVFSSDIIAEGSSVSITGVATTATTLGVQMRSNSVIASGGSANVTIATDSLELLNTSSGPTIRAGANGDALVVIRPTTPGTKINLGGADVMSGSPLTLGIDAFEIGRINAGTIQIGDVNSGPIAITALTHATPANLTLTTGDSIGITGAVFWNVGDITLNSAGPILQTGSARQFQTRKLTVNAPFQTAVFSWIGNQARKVFVSQYTSLIVNGSFDSSGVLDVEGVIGGAGSVGNVTVTGTGYVSPGDLVGKLTTGQVTLKPGANFYFQVSGTNPGVNYDQLAVTGTVNLNGAILSGQVGFSPAIGQVFKIIDNDGTSDPVIGKFQGLPEGATVKISSKNFTISYHGGDGNDVTLTRQPPPPTVSSVIFGDGTAQRSLVKQLVVTFSEPVNFMGGVASAFTLRRSGTGGTIGDVTLTANPANGPASVVTITFSGALTEFGSLIDGLYDLTIDAAQVSGVGGALDGNGDFIPGGSYSVTGTTANKFYRLFGDSDGDGALSQAVDLIAFRNAFGSPSSIFDFDDDGAVDQDDFIKFRNNFSGGP